MDYSLLVVTFIAAALVFIPVISKGSRYLSTVFHEVGHVMGSFMTGGGARSIKIRWDTSGVAGTTHSVGVGGFFSRIATLLSGYATPINLGAILIGLSFTQWVDVGFWVIVAFSVVAFLLIRNLFGFLLTGLFVGLMAALIFIPTPLTHQQIVLGFGLVLFFNGVKDVFMVASHAFTGRVAEEEMTDFHILSEATSVPSQVWFVLFVISELVFFTGITFLGIFLHDTQF